MFIRILDDGTIVAYNTEEAKDFLSPLGELETSGKSQIKTFPSNRDIQFIFVRDEEGHICHVCKENRFYFAEIVDEAKLSFVLRICFQCILLLSIQSKLATDEFDENLKRA